MKERFYLFQRASGIFFIQDSLTGKQTTTHTRKKSEAQQILNARRQATQQPHLNIAIAHVHLAAADPSFLKRTWRMT